MLTDHGLCSGHELKIFSTSLIFSPAASAWISSMDAFPWGSTSAEGCNAAPFYFNGAFGGTWTNESCLCPKSRSGKIHAHKNRTATAIPATKEDRLGSLAKGFGPNAWGMAKISYRSGIDLFSCWHSEIGSVAPEKKAELEHGSVSFVAGSK